MFRLEHTAELKEDLWWQAGLENIRRCDTLITILRECGSLWRKGKYQVDDYIREKGLPASFLYTGNFFENMVYRSHMQYDREKDAVEFRQPVIKETTTRE